MKLFGTLVGVFLILIGVSRVWAASDSDGKLVSQWIMSDFSAGEIKNKLLTGGALSDLTLEDVGAPKLVEEAGVKGLLFGEGEVLIGKSNDIPILGGFGEAGQPFSVRMVIVPLGKSPGAYGGLFEAMIYQKCGFRLVLDQSMRLGVEVFSEEAGKGFPGKTALSSGMVYTVELRFDGIKTTLLVDGEVDGEMEVGLPEPFTGGLAIGRASGDRYYFNGVISEVSIFSLKP